MERHSQRERDMERRDVESQSDRERAMAFDNCGYRSFTSCSKLVGGMNLCKNNGHTINATATYNVQRTTFNCDNNVNNIDNNFSFDALISQVGGNSMRVATSA